MLSAHVSFARQELFINKPHVCSHAIDVCSSSVLLDDTTERRRRLMAKRNAKAPHFWGEEETHNLINILID